MSWLFRLLGKTAISTSRAFDRVEPKAADVGRPGMRLGEAAGHVRRLVVGESVP